MIESGYLPTPLERATSPPPQPSTRGQVNRATNFGEVLEERLNTSMVKFSGHAMERVRERGISLREEDLDKLEGAVTSVAAKGGNESLIMVGEAAFVVSVKNRTVITAFDRRSLDENVFTRIDSVAFF